MLDNSIDFPTLPPYQGLQKDLYKGAGNAGTPNRRATGGSNHFLLAQNPNESTVSHTSMNLESLNQRNQARLARLEKVDPLEGSVFKMDSSSRRGSGTYAMPVPVPNISDNSGMLQDSADPYSRIRLSLGMQHQDIGPRWQGGTDVELAGGSNLRATPNLDSLNMGVGSRPGSRQRGGNELEELDFMLADILRK